MKNLLMFIFIFYKISSFDEKILNAVNELSNKVSSSSSTSTGTTTETTTTTTSNPFKDKWVSILGGGISTYKGYNINEYTSDNYPTSDVDDVSKTWWHILLTKLGAKLCVNNSVNTQIVVSSKYPEAADNLHRESGKTYINLDGTTETATERIDPDIILIDLGADDYINASTLGEFAVKYVSDDPTPGTFYDKYNYMLNAITNNNYPNAQIYCLDNAYCLKTDVSTNQTEYQQAIRDEARIYGLKCLHVSSLCVHAGNIDTYLVNSKNPKSNMMKMIANQCYNEMMADNCL